jgi:gamma-glutamylcyclotransferase (GGCT)/AIG2-like uncharacterized protein YtfP
MNKLPAHATPTHRTTYFAYGSNMSTTQMATRCPRSELIGVARLDGWALRIDARGVATVDAADAAVFGLLWSLTDADEATLDRYEGVAGGFYSRRRLSVTGPLGQLTALVYIGNDHDRGTPRPGYLEVLVDSAVSAGLPEDYVAGITALGGFANSGTGR